MYRPTEISTSDPTTNDDYSFGFGDGNYWFNTALDKWYILVDGTTGAADWRLISSGASVAWADYVPTFTWGGGVPTMTYVARYSVVNKKVSFTLLFQAANSSGSTATSVSVSLPVAPKDNNTFIPIYAQYAMSTITDKTSIYGDQLFIIDASNGTPATRKLYCIPNFSLPHGDTWTWIMEGFYEIT